jgi:DNA invertase Pin-like site-specific DNA recombinase
MQVVGYVRVSIEDQVKEGTSLAAQQARIDTYTVVQDWALDEAVVAMMHAWRAAGLSYRAVADELNWAGSPHG